MNKTLILENNKVSQKLERMALEILERTADHKQVLLAGIEQTGYEISRMIGENLSRFSDKNWPVYRIKINKSDPLGHPLETDVPLDSLTGATLILVDDVQNSGKTMIYTIRHFLQYPLQSIQTAVLVDRVHNSFPVKADYVGLSLSTTLQETVNVVVNGKNVEVFLT